ncbi:MAG: DUF5412 family protein [Ruminococcus sp.]|nr:DUF5412 family protein [Ruminococcus sp.]
MKKSLLSSAIIILILLLSGCGMGFLPKGDYLKSSVSPNGTYKVNAYVCNGGATIDFSVRCEVETIENQQVRNIYWQYHKSDVEIEWRSDFVVKIDEIELDVTKDSYDWRNN